MIEFVCQGHVDKIVEYMEQLENAGEQGTLEYHALSQLKETFEQGLEDNWKMSVQRWAQTIPTWSPWWDYEPDMFEDVRTMYGEDRLA